LSELAYPLPEIGEPSLAADPRTLEALINIKAWSNGQIDATNLKALGITLEKLAAESVNESKLTKAVAELLNNKTAGGETKKSIIATEQTRENAAYGTLTTPDEVTVTMPTNGLIAVWYSATWQQSEPAGGARAAIFMGANQLKVAAPAIATAPVVQAATLEDVVSTTGANPLASFPGGLIGVRQAATFGPDATTGQAVGVYSQGATLDQELNGAVQEGGPARLSVGGPCYIFAAAGAYKITIQFKVATGNVKVKNRKLWALAIA
jgi:hypothetical protein